MTGTINAPKTARVLGLGRRVGCWLYAATLGPVGIVRLAIGLFLFCVIIGNIGFSTERDVAFRNIDPNTGSCQSSMPDGWPILARRNVQNDERRAIDNGLLSRRRLANSVDPHYRKPLRRERHAMRQPPVDWAMRLRCSVQRHAVPWNLRYTIDNTSSKPPKPKRALTYDLAFVEFQEDGDPYPVAAETGAPYPLKELAARKARDQLEALTQHLRANSGRNYVIAWVHGWRHNADIGDGNVADLRIYAARAAKHLEARCRVEGRDCNRNVTAVYLGWRGARVDESKLARTFGAFGTFIAQVAAVPTLFDRKPVSEAIAPQVISAIRTINVVLDKAKGDKVIVFGHSLGGNLLATGLQDNLVKIVARHPFHLKGSNPLIANPIADLVVLLNPASEAQKWTELQRTVWRKLAIVTSDNVEDDETRASHRFFPRAQKPLIVSVTAALAWPPGGIRPRDCAWVERDLPPLPADATAEARDNFRKLKARQDEIRLEIAKAQQILDNGIEYDLATHDLFPAFKLDFRPFADQLERNALRRVSNGKSSACHQPQISLWSSPVAWTMSAFAGLLRNMPFMNTNAEETRTIGHLDPARNVSGDISTRLVSWKPFGTTHEIAGYELPDRDRALAMTRSLRRSGAAAYCLPDDSSTRWPAYSDTGTKDKPVAYERISGVRPCSCPATTGWLYRARDRLKQQNGVYWDTSALPESESGTRHRPVLRFLHGFASAGLQAITRANDPFWNVRAFDNVLARHDGFMLPSFICAMNSLVMDDTTAEPPPSVETSPSTAPKEME
ncbi:MAG: hypothetical protein KDJ25_11465 [Rhodoblastus sp.]|nr:hypothetical protein [Rhodoblastus sp.]